MEYRLKTKKMVLKSKLHSVNLLKVLYHQSKTEGIFKILRKLEKLSSEMLCFLNRREINYNKSERNSYHKRIIKQTKGFKSLILKILYKK